MKRTLITTFVIFLLMFAHRSEAQETLTLTMEQAKAHALEYNRALQKAGISVEEAQSSLWQAVAAGLPQVSGTIDYTNYLGFNMNFGGQSIPFNPASNAKLTVSQLLFSGSYWVGVEMSKIAKSLSEKNKIKTELDTKEAVSISFHAILVTEQGRKIILQNLANIKDIHKKTSDMAKVGLIEQTDAEQLSVQVLNMEAALRSLDRQLELAYNMMRLQLGVPPDTKIVLVGDIDEMAKGVNAQSLANSDFDPNNNIDFQLLKEQERLQEKQILMNQTEYLPTVSGFYSYTHKLKKASFDMSPPNVVGLQANIPVFSSFQRRSKVKQSKLQLRALQKDIEQVNDQLNTQAKQLRYNLQTAYDQYVIQKENVEVTRKIFKSNSLKHEQGMLSSLDLTTANNNYLQAENNLLTATGDLLKAQTELLKLLGTL
ncbi:MAG: TolC family protein [Prevotellaceae bacterium]|jgi:outer membrane protein TolC|nr:TolC family protein [Prevotellaceae bacterium]